MELSLSTYSIAQHVKCDLARPWVRGALKKNLGVRNCENFREKTRERAANFVRFRCNAHAKLDRRAPRALRNMHDVGAAPSRIIASFLFTIRVVR